MDRAHDVLPISSLAGKAVLSLQTGNKLGELRDLILDPINGLVLGLAIAGPEGVEVCLPYAAVYSFGHDAVMAVSESPMCPLAESKFATFPRAADLIGTRIITVSGNLLGQIRNVFVTMRPPPVVIYSFGESMFDRLLGREMYLGASSAYILSDDAERLVVPDETAERAARSIEEVIEPAVSVRSFDTSTAETGNDDTWVVSREDEFETILHSDDDDTVIRLRSDLTPRQQTG